MQKMYIDSRSRVSGSNTDFEFALPYSITIPKESLMIVDKVVIPNSFYTIEQGVNDNIYVQEREIAPLSFSGALLYLPVTMTSYRSALGLKPP